MADVNAQLVAIALKPVNSIADVIAALRRSMEPFRNRMA